MVKNYYPPLPTIYPPINEQVVNTLLDIRNLGENTQKTYAKCLKRLSRNIQLDSPSEVENYVYSYVSHFIISQLASGCNHSSGLLDHTLSSSGSPSHVLGRVDHV